MEVLKTLPPNILGHQSWRNSLILQQLGMDPNHQNLFVVRPVEDADPAALRYPLHGAPQTIVVQFFRRWSLERIHLYTLRIHARHHVLDGAILAGRVHGLKNEQHSPVILSIELALQLSHGRDACGQKLLSVLLGVNLPRIPRIEILQPELRAVLDSIGLNQFAGPAHPPPPSNPRKVQSTSM